MNLRQLALDALLIGDPDEKSAAVAAIPHTTGDDPLASPDVHRLCAETLPGRSSRPLLVPPTQLAPRSVTSHQGRAALCHSLAHIELNAIKFGFNECNDRFFKLVA
ncbi:MAG: DUF455 family protein [Candidatus Accumulibacter sp.]|jgi:uncharacterized ferritin-like protein (DUF455 family)|uniref:DUF455 family protein n=1 Tax=Accumulibacter sp. TaxID=2053492 RepID=UPI001A63EF54|nr:DUF455 family protein [Accumulibacter sp.]MBL8395959.1 DUF455 family protein [Accumulibacter sp.]